MQNHFSNKPTNKPIAAAFIFQQEVISSQGSNLLSNLWQALKKIEIIKEDTPSIEAYDYEHNRKVLFIQIKSFENLELFNAGGQLANITANTTEDLEIFLPRKEFDNNALEQLILGFELGRYRFTKYRTTSNSKYTHSLQQCFWIHPKSDQLENLHQSLSPITQGVNLCRSLVNEPSNHLTPTLFTQHISALNDIGIKTTILDEASLIKHNMNALLGVGAGSNEPSFLAIMEWNGHPNTDEPPCAFVGKGVCFDTGGISLKPPKGMDEMKFDMGGAACVTGLMKTLALRNAKVNAVGIVALVENMPDGKAQKPGDIVTSMSGKTIEIMNTDAEGRLILADALWYTQEHFKPQFIIDLATLTGAMLVSLGHEYAGVFTNKDTLFEQLSNCGKATNEKVWQFPLHTAYDKKIESNSADVKNLGDHLAGSITAAQFLQRFIQKGTNWAHIDIAGTAWEYNGQPGIPKGASGYGVQLLNKFIKQYYEPV